MFKYLILGLVMINEIDLNEYCYQPNKSLVNFCKDNKIPTISFPKGLKNNYKNLSRL